MMKQEQAYVCAQIIGQRVDVHGHLDGFGEPEGGRLDEGDAGRSRVLRRDWAWVGHEGIKAWSKNAARLFSSPCDAMASVECLYSKATKDVTMAIDDARGQRHPAFAAVNHVTRSRGRCPTLARRLLLRAHRVSVTASPRSPALQSIAMTSSSASTSAQKRKRNEDLAAAAALMQEEEGADSDHPIEDDADDAELAHANLVTSTEAGPSRTSLPSDKPIKKRKKQFSGASGPSPGIVYVSRIPPGMTPQKVKHLMERWGDVGRIYAQKRDRGWCFVMRASTLRAHPIFGCSRSATVGKAKPKHEKANYAEAWVEFLDKKTAKTVAEMLNAQMIGGKKGDRCVLVRLMLPGRTHLFLAARVQVAGRYLDDEVLERLQMGNAGRTSRCVPGALLTSFAGTAHTPPTAAAYERQAHTARLRQSLSQSKTEQAEYLRNVELARVIDKRKARRAEKEGAGAVAAGPTPADGDKEAKAKRHYRQRKMLSQDEAAPLDARTLARTI